MKLKFNVTGMTCAACSARVEKVTSQVSGVEMCEVNLLAGTMVVEAESENIAQAVSKAVSDAGYHAQLVGDKSNPVKREEKAENPLKEMKIRIIGSGICLAASATRRG